MDLNDDMPPRSEAGGLALVRDGVAIDRESMRQSITSRTVELAVRSLEDGLVYRSAKVCRKCGEGMPGLPKLGFTRTALELAGLIGQEKTSVSLILARDYGISGTDELKQIVDAHRASSAVSLEQCERDGVDLLRWVMEQAPDRRSAILEALDSPGANGGGANGALAKG